MTKSVAVSPRRTGFGPLLFCGRLEEGLASVKRAGLDGVELSLPNPREVDLEDLLSLVKRYGIEVSTIATGQSYYNEGISLSHPDPKIRGEAVERIGFLVDFASSLGAKVIIGGIRGKTGQRPPTEEEWKRFLRALEECVRLAEKRKVTLLLEPINRYETNLVNTVKEAKEVISQIGSERLKILPDTFHMNIEEASMEESLVEAGDLLGGLHVADSNRLAPGWGHIDFHSIGRALKEVGFREFVCAEVLPQPDDLSALEKAAQFLKDFP
ncbi:MAG TPA: sugar phosphate isomerase/epimerase [Armatimonadetes bacterium]|nr:sugar phosphate isomerase/epimerase [Armatimonadota bacterium]